MFINYSTKHTSKQFPVLQHRSSTYFKIQDDNLTVTYTGKNPSQAEIAVIHS